MRCARLIEIGRLQVEEAPIPDTGPGEVRLKVLGCALCRTDAKMWRSGHRDLQMPRILGHEMVAEDEPSGRRYVIWPGTACGTCRPCRDGRENLCPHMRIQGFHRDGGLAEQVVAAVTALVPVPNELPAAVAALAEPLACTLNALEQAAVSAAERVLIVGGGPVGLLMALAVKDRGAEPFILERSRERLLRSQAYREAVGFEAAETLAEAPEFPVAVNAAAAPQALEAAIGNLQAAGRLAFFSGLSGPGPVSSAVLNTIHYRQLRVSGAYGCTREQMGWAVRLLRKYAEPAAMLIGREIALDRVEPALAEILMGRVMKIVVRP